MDGIGDYYGAVEDMNKSYKEKKQLEQENAKLKAENEKYKHLYNVINKMMAVVGAEGQVGTQDSVADEVMNALYDIDGGEYKPKPLQSSRDIESLKEQEIGRLTVENERLREGLKEHAQNGQESWGCPPDFVFNCAGEPNECGDCWVGYLTELVKQKLERCK